MKVMPWLKDWYPAAVEGSNPKAIDQMSRGQACYLKLSELSFEAVKFALFDHQHRLRAVLPQLRRAVVIREVRFAGGALNGIRVPLSASLNCLIGPRGNGKSAVIECLRHALDFREDRDAYQTILENLALIDSGRVTRVA